MKKIDIETIKDIFSKVVIKKSFYERELTENEFYALDDLFVSLHFHLKNIDIAPTGTIRFYTTNLIGIEFYFNFLLKFPDQNFGEIIIKRLI